MHHETNRSAKPRARFRSIATIVSAQLCCCRRVSCAAQLQKRVRGWSFHWWLGNSCCSDRELCEWRRGCFLDSESRGETRARFGRGAVSKRNSMTTSKGPLFLWTCGSISPKTNNIVGVPRCEAQRGVASQLAHAGGHTGSTFSVCDAHRTRISHNAAP